MGSVARVIVGESLFLRKLVLGNGWTIDQPTFNYKMPCALEDTNFTAIVVHGTNRKDIYVWWIRLISAPQLIYWHQRPFFHKTPHKLF
jgi:hypothetical protein